MITQNKMIKAGLVGLCLALPMGCSQNVSIQRIDEMNAEAAPGYSSVEGKVLSSEYTQNAHCASNRLSFIVQNNGKNTLCYTNGRCGSDDENRNYNLASTVVKSAQGNNTNVKVTGMQRSEYFEIKSVEANGFRVNFD
jgi:hypothetical protein